MRKTTRSAVAVACVAFVSACASEQATAPDKIENRADAMNLVGGIRGERKDTIAAAGVFRLVPLAQSITVSKIIGVAGGSISIPEAGVMITVPEGAVAAETEISVTARQGSLVAYDVRPRGVVFSKALIFSQQLSGTNAPTSSIKPFQLGSYEGASALTSRGVSVSELTDGSVDPDNVFTAEFSRASGYIMSCGRRVASAGEEM